MFCRKVIRPCTFVPNSNVKIQPIKAFKFKTDGNGSIERPDSGETGLYGPTFIGTTVFSKKSLYKLH